MNKPPFSLPPLGGLQTLLDTLPSPPPWLQAELHNRLLLLLNHVLMQEPAATERLKRQCGKTVQVHWGRFTLGLQATPAGLLALAEDVPQPDLRLQLTETSPLALAQTVLAGGKPQVDIQGDVQLAAEVAWLVDNVRWDVEEDLSRLLGDAPAHTLVQGVRTLAQALPKFLNRSKAAP